MYFAVAFLVLFLSREVCAFYSATWNPNPSEVHIGGLFAPVTSAGVRNLAQAEHLAAFLLALDNINNKTDGFHDDLLPHTKLTFSIRGGNELQLAFVDFIYLEQSFQGEGVFAMVSAQETDDALLVNQLSTKLSTPTILSVANSGEFGDHVSYPYLSETVALVSYQGNVIQNLLCSYFNARKVVTVSSSMEEDIFLMNSFLDASVCKLNILADISVRASDVTLDTQISEALTTGARYFVVFLPSFQVAQLLEQGYKAGLFKANTVIITSDRGYDNITNFLASSTDFAGIMTGLFTLKYVPNFYMNKTTEARQFAQRWRSQPSTEGKLIGGKWHCNTAMDDAKENYLYQATVNNKTVCSGIDFSLYSMYGLDISPYTALTYDATVMMAMALDAALDQNLNYFDPEVIEKLLSDNISFVGATGPINLSGGSKGYGGEGAGSRSTGNVYEVINFNPDLYHAESPDFMVSIGVFNGDVMTFVACESVNDPECYLPVFNGKTDGSVHIPPSDTPDPIYVDFSHAQQVILFALSVITVFLVVVFFLFTIYYLKHKVIKASQPALLYFILFGGLIASVRIWLGGMDKADEICVGEFFFGHLSFVVIIGSLFVKSYRVHCIVNTKTLKKVTFSTFDAVKLHSSIVLVTLIYLSFSIGFGQPHLHNQYSTANNQTTILRYCSMLDPQFQTALYCIEGVALVIAFRICWEIRNVPDVVNESKQISTAMATVVLISVLVLPIVYFLGIAPYSCELIASLGFGFGTITVLTFLFVPKVFMIYSMSNEKMRSAKVAAAVAGGGNPESNKGNHNSNAGVPTIMRLGSGPRAILDVEELIKGKSKEEILLFSQEQVQGWQAFLMARMSAALHSSDSDQSKLRLPEPELGSPAHDVPVPERIIAQPSGPLFNTDTRSSEKSPEKYIATPVNYDKE